MSLCVCLSVLLINTFPFSNPPRQFCSEAAIKKGSLFSGPRGTAGSQERSLNAGDAGPDSNYSVRIMGYLSVHQVFNPEHGMKYEKLGWCVIYATVYWSSRGLLGRFQRAFSWLNWHWQWSSSSPSSQSLLLTEQPWYLRWWAALQSCKSLVGSLFPSASSLPPRRAGQPGTDFWDCFIDVETEAGWLVAFLQG